MIDLGCDGRCQRGRSANWPILDEYARIFPAALAHPDFMAHLGRLFGHLVEFELVAEGGDAGSVDHEL